MLAYMMNIRDWALRLALLSSGMLTACVEADGDTVPRRSSGQRLIPRYLIGEDESKQYRGWYDTKLDLNCYFRRESRLDEADEMHYRCVPEAFYPNEDSYFSDERCSEPVTVVHIYDCESLTQVKYARIRSTSCGEAPVYRKIKSVERIGAKDKLWRKFRDSLSSNAQERCEEAKASSKEQILRIELGESMDFDSFVKGTEESTK